MSAQGGTWKKYEAPPDFLKVEEKQKTLQLTDEQLNKIYMEYLYMEYANAKEKAEKISWANMIAKRKSGQQLKRFKEAFVEDFLLWLQGRSKYNVTSRVERYKEGAKQKIKTKIVDYTPWGNKPLNHVPGVNEFLEQPVMNRDHVIKTLTKLKMTWPRNLDEAWIYYKYLVRKVGIDGDTIKEQEMFSDFDYLNKIPDQIKLNREGRRTNKLEPNPDYTLGSTNNPRPPQFNNDIYRRQRTNVYNQAKAGKLDLQSSSFTSLAPGDQLIALIYYRPEPVEVVPTGILFPDLLTGPPAPIPDGVVAVNKYFKTAAPPAASSDSASDVKRTKSYLKKILRALQDQTVRSDELLHKKEKGKKEKQERIRLIIEKIDEIKPFLKDHNGILIGETIKNIIPEMDKFLFPKLKKKKLEKVGAIKIDEPDLDVVLGKVVGAVPATGTSLLDIPAPTEPAIVGAVRTKSNEENLWYKTFDRESMLKKIDSLIEKSDTSEKLKQIELDKFGAGTKVYDDYWGKLGAKLSHGVEIKKRTDDLDEQLKNPKLTMEEQNKLRYQKNHVVYLNYKLMANPEMIEAHKKYNIQREIFKKKKEEIENTYKINSSYFTDGHSLRQLYSEIHNPAMFLERYTMEEAKKIKNTALKFQEEAYSKDDDSERIKQQSIGRKMGGLISLMNGKDDDALFGFKSMLELDPTDLDAEGLPKKLPNGKAFNWYTGKVVDEKEMLKEMKERINGGDGGTVDKGEKPEEEKKLELEEKDVVDKKVAETVDTVESILEKTNLNEGQEKLKAELELKEKTILEKENQIQEKIKEIERLSLGKEEAIKAAEEEKSKLQAEIQNLKGETQDELSNLRKQLEEKENKTKALEEEKEKAVQELEEKYKAEIKELNSEQNAKLESLKKEELLKIRGKYIGLNEKQQSEFLKRETVMRDEYNKKKREQDKKHEDEIKKLKENYESVNKKQTDYEITMLKFKIEELESTVEVKEMDNAKLKRGETLSQTKELEEKYEKSLKELEEKRQIDIESAKIETKEQIEQIYQTELEKLKKEYQEDRDQLITVGQEGIDKLKLEKQDLLSNKKENEERLAKAEKELKEKEELIKTLQANLMDKETQEKEKLKKEQEKMKLEEEKAKLEKEREMQEKENLSSQMINELKAVQLRESSTRYQNGEITEKEFHDEIEKANKMELERTNQLKSSGYSEEEMRILKSSFVTMRQKIELTALAKQMKQQEQEQKTKQQLENIAKQYTDNQINSKVDIIEKKYSDAINTGKVTEAEVNEVRQDQQKAYTEYQRSYMVMNQLQQQLKQHPANQDVLNLFYENKAYAEINKKVLERLQNVEKTMQINWEKQQAELKKQQDAINIQRAEALKEKQMQETKAVEEKKQAQLMKFKEGNTFHNDLSGTMRKLEDATKARFDEFGSDNTSHKEVIDHFYKRMTGSIKEQMTGLYQKIKEMVKSKIDKGSDEDFSAMNLDELGEYADMAIKKEMQTMYSTAANETMNKLEFAISDPKGRMLKQIYQSDYEKNNYFDSFYHLFSGKSSETRLQENLKEMPDIIQKGLQNIKNMDSSGYSGEKLEKYQKILKHWENLSGFEAQSRMRGINDGERNSVNHHIFTSLLDLINSGDENYEYNHTNNINSHNTQLNNRISSITGEGMNLKTKEMMENLLIKTVSAQNIVPEIEQLQPKTNTRIIKEILKDEMNIQETNNRIETFAEESVNLDKVAAQLEKPQPVLDDEMEKSFEAKNEMVNVSVSQGRKAVDTIMRTEDIYLRKKRKLEPVEPKESVMPKNISKSIFSMATSAMKLGDSAIQYARGYFADSPRKEIHDKVDELVAPIRAKKRRIIEEEEKIKKETTKTVTRKPQNMENLYKPTPIQEEMNKLFNTNKAFDDVVESHYLDAHVKEDQKKDIYSRFIKTVQKENSMELFDAEISLLRNRMENEKNPLDRQIVEMDFKKKLEEKQLYSKMVENKLTMEQKDYMPMGFTMEQNQFMKMVSEKIKDIREFSKDPTRSNDKEREILTLKNSIKVHTDIARSKLNETKKTMDEYLTTIVELTDPEDAEIKKQYQDGYIEASQYYQKEKAAYSKMIMAVNKGMFNNGIAPDVDIVNQFHQGTTNVLKAIPHVLNTLENGAYTVSQSKEIGYNEKKYLESSFHMTNKMKDFINSSSEELKKSHSDTLRRLNSHEKKLRNIFTRKEQNIEEEKKKQTIEVLKAWNVASRSEKQRSVINNPVGVGNARLKAQSIHIKNSHSPETVKKIENIVSGMLSNSEEKVKGEQAKIMSEETSVIQAKTKAIASKFTDKYKNVTFATAEEMMKGIIQTIAETNKSLFSGDDGHPVQDEISKYMNDIEIRNSDLYIKNAMVPGVRQALSINGDSEMEFDGPLPQDMGINRAEMGGGPNRGESIVSEFVKSGGFQMNSSDMPFTGGGDFVFGSGNAGGGGGGNMGGGDNNMNGGGARFVSGPGNYDRPRQIAAAKNPYEHLKDNMNKKAPTDVHDMEEDEDPEMDSLGKTYGPSRPPTGMLYGNMKEQNLAELTREKENRAGDKEKYMALSRNAPAVEGIKTMIRAFAEAESTEKTVDFFESHINPSVNRLTPGFEAMETLQTIKNIFHTAEPYIMERNTSIEPFAFNTAILGTISNFPEVLNSSEIAKYYLKYKDYIDSTTRGMAYIQKNDIDKMNYPSKRTLSKFVEILSETGVKDPESSNYQTVELLQSFIDKGIENANFDEDEYKNAYEEMKNLQQYNIFLEPSEIETLAYSVNYFKSMSRTLKAITPVIFEISDKHEKMRRNMSKLNLSTKQVEELKKNEQRYDQVKKFCEYQVNALSKSMEFFGKENNFYKNLSDFNNIAHTMYGMDKDQIITNPKETLTDYTNKLSVSFGSQVGALCASILDLDRIYFNEYKDLVEGIAQKTKKSQRETMDKYRINPQSNEKEKEPETVKKQKIDEPHPEQKPMASRHLQSLQKLNQIRRNNAILQQAKLRNETEERNKKLEVLNISKKEDMPLPHKPLEQNNVTEERMRQLQMKQYTQSQLRKYKLAEEADMTNFETERNTNQLTKLLLHSFDVINNVADVPQATKGERDKSDLSNILLDDLLNKKKQKHGDDAMTYDDFMRLDRNQKLNEIKSYSDELREEQGKMYIYEKSIRTVKKQVEKEKDQKKMEMLKIIKEYYKKTDPETRKAFVSKIELPPMNYSDKPSMELAETVNASIQKESEKIKESTWEDLFSEENIKKMSKLNLQKASARETHIFRAAQRHIREASTILSQPTSPQFKEHILRVLKDQAKNDKQLQSTLISVHKATQTSDKVTQVLQTNQAAIRRIALEKDETKRKEMIKNLAKSQAVLPKKTIPAREKNESDRMFDEPSENQNNDLVLKKKEIIKKKEQTKLTLKELEKEQFRLARKQRRAQLLEEQMQSITNKLEEGVHLKKPEPPKSKEERNRLASIALFNQTVAQMTEKYSKQMSMLEAEDIQWKAEKKETNKKSIPRKPEEIEKRRKLFDTAKEALKEIESSKKDSKIFNEWHEEWVAALGHHNELPFPKKDPVKTIKPSSKPKSENVMQVDTPKIGNTGKKAVEAPPPKPQTKEEKIKFLKDYIARIEREKQPPKVDNILEQTKAQLHELVNLSIELKKDPVYTANVKEGLEKGKRDREAREREATESANRIREITRKLNEKFYRIEQKKQKKEQKLKTLKTQIHEIEHTSNPDITKKVIHTEKEKIKTHVEEVKKALSFNLIPKKTGNRKRLKPFTPKKK